MKKLLLKFQTNPQVKTILDLSPSRPLAGLLTGLLLSLTGLLLLSLTACRAKKSLPAAPTQVIPVQTITDTKIVHIETVDTVLIEIPAQSAERTTTCKESHLETDYAESDARINEDGTLSHKLYNKPTKHPVPVKNERDTIYINNAVEVPVPIEVPVEVERELTTWQRIRLHSWPYLAVALLLSIVYTNRKTIFRGLR